MFVCPVTEGNVIRTSEHNRRTAKHVDSAYYCPGILAASAPPRYQDIRGREAGLLSSDDEGALVRVIAGEVAGRRDAKARPATTCFAVPCVISCGI